MFGYICINQQELKGKDFDMYRSYYCGLCNILKKRYGRIGQMLLNYDLTFLAILLTGLYEPEEREKESRCLLHPARKHLMRDNGAVEYAADMTVMLSFQKARDDWMDERKTRARALCAILRPDYRRLREQYPRQAEALEKSVRALSKAERSGNCSLDQMCSISGHFLGEIFVWKEDEWEKTLREMGRCMGRFIYLLDAYDDLDRDKKNGNYNVLEPIRRQYPQEFEGLTEELLVGMMADCAKAFERLPVLHLADILRNIIYCGVWTKYLTIRKKRSEEDRAGRDQKE